MAPYFPNLLEEGKLGYDLKLNLDSIVLFFQYKLPEYMVRATAVEVSKYRLDTLGLPVPFFRMNLMRRNVSAQHKLLVGMDKRYPGSVFYVAPFMKSGKEFNEAYINVKVHERAFLFSPSSIGPLPDSGQHRVAFHYEPHCAWFCSEPKQVDAYTVDNAIERLSSNRALPLNHQVDSIVSTVNEAVREIDSQRFGKLREFAKQQHIREVRSRIVNPSGMESQINSGIEDSIMELLIARKLAQIGLGMDLLIFQRFP